MIIINCLWKNPILFIIKYLHCCFDVNSRTPNDTPPNFLWASYFHFESSFRMPDIAGLYRKGEGRLQKTCPDLTFFVSISELILDFFFNPLSSLLVLSHIASLADPSNLAVIPRPIFSFLNQFLFPYRISLAAKTRIGNLRTRQESLLNPGVLGSHLLRFGLLYADLLIYFQYITQNVGAPTFILLRPNNSCNHFLLSI